MNNHYNYIITGSGCAGLSLLMRIMQHSFFSDKQILIIDQSQKNKNDHTWCFWEKENGLFQQIVHHQWKQLNFYSDDYSSRFDIDPYQYKMIRSVDFYNYVLSETKQHANIHFHFGNVQSVNNENDKAVATVAGEKFYADYLFNSIFFQKPEIKKNKYYLLQHFKGWLIETAENVFDKRIATFMDFRISQKQETAFVYVLPVAANKALVEYTLFTEQPLRDEEYNLILKNYIAQYLTTGSYKILEEEFGVIPMTNYSFLKGAGRIVNIGTAGGQTKASSGFTFQFIQKNSQEIADALIKQRDPHIAKSFFQKRFYLYDSILLNILHHKKMSGAEIFSRLFQKNSRQQILQFLDNETTFSKELKIMQSMPMKIFFPAALKELFDF